MRTWGVTGEGCSRWLVYSPPAFCPQARASPPPHPSRTCSCSPRRPRSATTRSRPASRRSRRSAPPTASTVDATEDSTAFTAANLAQYDAVVFLSTTGDVLTAEQQDAFEDYIAAGNGYVGIHAAADTEYEWDWYGDLVGAYFASHPPGTPTATVDVEDATHPSTAPVPARWTRTDEWYNYKPPAAGATAGARTTAARYDVHVLATLDETTYDEQDGSASADDHPIAWCSNFAGGHSWYTGMGHTSESFAEPAFRAHLLGGLQSVTDLAGAGCGPNQVPSPSAADFEKVTLDDDTENPFELDIAPDGRVFYIERDGRVMVWKPTTETTVQVGAIPVTQSQENGLLGIQLAPDFMTTGHIYLAYSALPDSSNQNRLSRFTVVGDQIEPGSEQFIYTWQHQREECCHTGGLARLRARRQPLHLDGRQHQPVRVARLRAARRAPRPRGVGRPADGGELEQPERQDPAHRAAAGSERRARHRDHLHDPGRQHVRRGGPHGEPDAARDLRDGLPQPVPDHGRSASRAGCCSATTARTLASTNPNRGPQGSVEFNVVDQPGFYGWPYCVRDNVPYNDFNFPDGPSGPKFDCANPVNNSPNNTGLTNLPPAQPATTWHGYTRARHALPVPRHGRRADRRPALRLRPDQPEHDQVPRVLRRQVVRRRVERGLDQDHHAERRRQRPRRRRLRPRERLPAPDGHRVRARRLALRDRVGLRLRRQQPRLGHLPDRLRRRAAGGRSPRPTATRTPGRRRSPSQFSSEGSNDPDGTLAHLRLGLRRRRARSTRPRPTRPSRTPRRATTRRRCA